MKNKNIRSLVALILTVIMVVTSLFAVSTIASAADNLSVSFTKVHGRTAGDGLDGDNWLDYVVVSDPEILTDGSSTEIFTGTNELFWIDERGKYNLVFEFDAQSGYLYKNLGLSWKGIAQNHNKNYIKSIRIITNRISLFC